MPVPDGSDRELGETGPEPPADSPDAPEGRPPPAPAAARPQPSLAGDLAEVQRGRPERAFNFGLVVGIIVAVAAVVFVIQNIQSTHFDWLWFDFELPLWTALLGAMAVGVVLVVVGFAIHERRQRRIGRRRDAVGRIRRALGPEGEPPPQRGSRGGFLRRSRPERA